MNNKRVSDIKRAQKSSLFLKIISQLFTQAAMDNNNLLGVYVNRVELSPDKGHCTVYFCAHGGKEEFDQKVGELILYKPSLRAALSKQISGRYTPEIRFKFDETAAKVDRIETLLEDIKSKGEL